MRFKRPRLLVVVAMMGAMLALLAACYLPNHFIAEIRLGHTGDYSIYYKGDLTWAPLYRDIRRGTLSPAEAQKRIEGIRADLARDPNFKSIVPTDQGIYHVEYKREGHLEDSEQVTFVRRNAVILMIKSHPDGRITVNGNAIKPSDAQVATDLGLDVQGEFRITTDAFVLEQNSTSIKNYDGYTSYIWTVQNAFSPPPHFAIRREGAFPMKGPTKK